MIEETQDVVVNNEVTTDNLGTQPEETRNIEVAAGEETERDTEGTLGVNPELNFKKLREQTDKIKKERDEAVGILRQIEDQALAYQQQQQQLQSKNAEEEDIEIESDDYTSRRYVDKKFTNLQQQLKGYQSKVNEHTAEAKLKAQYKDFDAVVSKENVELLRQSYPELAASLGSHSDLYTKAKSVYTVIKKLGISQNDSFGGEREKVESNLNKPRASNSVSPQHGESPLHKANAFANGLTDDLKKQLYKEMLDARRNS